ncbi:hypothetical protein [Deinococcus humi]|uniref:Putative membrane protein n=1 Tax=Deinococcus humi TaxID=662880 RepID=A0A7W8JY65_9DEIO|nr:hypothetical protein [Deinococcus humi]MBB5365390.1 putative membrane protein [Deinococcus humi]GGO36069.1 hypothetical protein GCM10008949_39480 [Deinococcus humi]
MLISVITPDFVSNNPADLLALAVPLFAATCCSLLLTVVIGVMTAGVLRYLMA